MGRSRSFCANSAVSFDIGGNEVCGADGFLWVELPLVVGVFSILNLLQNLLFSAFSP
jgi:hypothetical protein